MTGQGDCKANLRETWNENVLLTDVVSSLIISVRKGKGEHGGQEGDPKLCNVSEKQTS